MPVLVPETQKSPENKALFVFLGSRTDAHRLYLVAVSPVGETCCKVHIRHWRGRLGLRKAAERRGFSLFLACRCGLNEGGAAPAAATKLQGASQP